MPVAASKPVRNAKSVASSPSSKKTAPRKEVREALNMRVRPELRTLIDRAAQLTGKNRTDFVLDAARQAAQDALLDQTVITLNPKAYAAFLAMLDAPPNANARLRKSLQTPAPWD